MHHEMKTAYAALIAIVFSLVLAGCLFQQTEVGTPTPTATSTTAPSPSQAATTIQPSPSPVASPSPSPAAQAYCELNVNPNDAQGPFRAAVSARFFELPNPGNVTIKCSAGDAPAQAEKKGEFYVVVCNYPNVLSRSLIAASASAQGVSCNTTVVVETNPALSKTWSFSPGDESFTVNQSQLNYTTRNYTITNTGSLELDLVSCTADQGFVTVSCPVLIKPGDTAPFNATYTVSGLSAGQQTVQLTVKEKDLSNIIRVSINVVT